MLLAPATKNNHRETIEASVESGFQKLTTTTTTKKRENSGGKKWKYDLNWSQTLDRKVNGRSLGLGSARDRSKV